MQRVPLDEPTAASTASSAPVSRSTRSSSSSNGSGSSVSPSASSLDNGVECISMSSVYRNDPVAHEALLRKVSWHLLPFLLVLYLFSFLDRFNLGNVHHALSADLGLSESQYGSALSIFFLPYVLGEIPSNMLMERVGARHWLARITLSWGACSTLLMLVQNHEQLMLGRFALGVAEAGLFPGMIYYLTSWLAPAERAQRLAFIFLAQPVSGILGGLLAYAILHWMDGVGGVAGWRWVFLIEGLPTVLLGFAVLLYLPSTPMEASWLTAEEKVFLTARMRGAKMHEHDDQEEQEGGEEAQIDLPSRATDRRASLDEDRSRSNSELGLVSERSIADSASGNGEVSAAFETSFQLEDDNDSALALPVAGDSAAVDGSLPMGQRSHDRYESLSWRERARLYYRTSKVELVRLYRSTFCNRILYLCILSNFLILMPVQSLSFYMPSIVSELGVGSLLGNLVSAIPYSVASVVMFAVSIHSDRTGERVWHIIACGVLGFVCMGVTAALMSGAGTNAASASERTPPSFGRICLQLAFLSGTASGVWACKPALMALFTSSLRGNKAVAIAAVTTFGNVSGIVAPILMASLRSESGSYASGCMLLMGCLIVACGTVYALDRAAVRALERDEQRMRDVQMSPLGKGRASVSPSAVASHAEPEEEEEQEADQSHVRPKRQAVPTREI